jgi:hypothetical protein
MEKRGEHVKSAHSGMQLGRICEMGSALIYYIRKKCGGIGLVQNLCGSLVSQRCFSKRCGKHLIQASEKTKGLRQWRFQHLNEINADEVRNYIQKAILNQSLGKEIKAATRSLAIPEELANVSKIIKQFKQLLKALQRVNKRNTLNIFPMPNVTKRRCLESIKSFP